MLSCCLYSQLFNPTVFSIPVFVLCFRCVAFIVLAVIAFIVTDPVAFEELLLPLRSHALNTAVLSLSLCRCVAFIVLAVIAFIFTGTIVDFEVIIVLTLL